MEYGIAIENFFNLELSLIVIFLVLTLVAIPQMIIFAAYDSGKSNEDTTFYDKFSFASLG